MKRVGWLFHSLRILPCFSRSWAFLCASSALVRWRRTSRLRPAFLSLEKEFFKFLPSNVKAAPSRLKLLYRSAFRDDDAVVCAMVSPTLFFRQQDSVIAPS